MRSINDFIIHYPKILKDKINYGGLELLNNDINHWKKYILHGEVIGLPLSVTLPEIKIGDKIYFKYQVPDGDNRIDETTIRVPYLEIFCYVRDGEIRVCNDHALCTAHYDDAEEVDILGKPVMVKTKGNLVISTDIEYDKKVTKAVYVPESAEFNEGDMVVMTRYSDQVYEVEGRDYFVIPLDEIVGKFV